MVRKNVDFGRRLRNDIGIADKLVVSVLRFQGQPERIVVIARIEKPPRVSIDKVVVDEAKLRKELVTIWFVDVLAREGAPDAVLVVVVIGVVCAGGPTLGQIVGSQFDILVKDHELGLGPGLARTSEIAPPPCPVHMIAASDEKISRLFGRNRFLAFFLVWPTHVGSPVVWRNCFAGG